MWLPAERPRGSQCRFSAEILLSGRPLRLLVVFGFAVLSGGERALLRSYESLSARRFLNRAEQATFSSWRFRPDCSEISVEGSCIWTGSGVVSISSALLISSVGGVSGNCDDCYFDRRLR